MSGAMHYDIAAVNGTRLYYESRGNGAPILFISGAFGDAGGWQRASEILANRYTTISYDRRGNSRSTAPPGWTSTSLDEQAADAAALIEHCRLGPAIVWASSLGGGIALTSCSSNWNTGGQP